MATDGMTRTADALPAELTSARAKLVFLYLRTSGETSIAELRDTLDVPRVTLYPTLRTLCERGLVVERDGKYRPVPEGSAGTSRPPR